MGKLNLRFYILFLLCLFSVSLLAEREASTSQEKELLKAVYQNDLGLVESLIEKRVAVDITDDSGKSLLMYAVWNQNKKLVRLLVERGANINYHIQHTIEPSPDLFLNSVIDYGIQYGDTAMVYLLIDLGLEIGVENKALENYLIVAYKQKELKIVQDLLNKGVQISPMIIQRLIVEEILNSQNSYYHPLDFRMIKVWDDYGFKLDSPTLLLSPSVKKIKERKKIIKYIHEYNEWLEVDGKLLNSNISTYQEQLILEQEQSEEAYVKAWIVIVIILIFMAIAYYKRKRLFSLWRLFFSQQNISPPSSSNNPNPSSHQKRAKKPQTPREPKGKKRKKTIKPARTPRVPQSPKVSKLAITSKGWTVDDTIGIEVNHLTIEDMINPIRMRNEHERAIREMIWYIRKLENLPAGSLAEKLQDEELSVKLNLLWLRIDPNNVRAVYKQSLYVLVENYSKRDCYLTSFLNLILKSK